MISLNTPIIILVLATVYLLSIYLLLHLAQRSLKIPRLPLSRVDEIK